LRREREREALTLRREREREALTLRIAFLFFSFIFQEARAVHGLSFQSLVRCAWRAGGGGGRFHSGADYYLCPRRHWRGPAPLVPLLGQEQGPISVHSSLLPYFTTYFTTYILRTALATHWHAISKVLYGQGSIVFALESWGTDLCL
jgi:hypothetical protein